MIDGAKDVKEQIDVLSRLLNVKPNSASKMFFKEMLPYLQEQVKLPDWIDGWFVCTNPYLDYAATVVDAFKKEFSSRGWCLKESAGGWLQRYLKTPKFTSKTELIYQKLLQEQTGNYWVLPMALANGARFSTNPAFLDREMEVLTDIEFGVGLIESLCALLSHFDERLFPGCLSMLTFPGTTINDLQSNPYIPALIWNHGTPSFLGINLPDSEKKQVAPVLGCYSW